MQCHKRLCHVVSQAFTELLVARTYSHPRRHMSRRPVLALLTMPGTELRSIVTVDVARFICNFTTPQLRTKTADDCAIPAINSQFSHIHQSTLAAGPFVFAYSYSSSCASLNFGVVNPRVRYSSVALCGTRFYRVIIAPVNVSHSVNAEEARKQLLRAYDEDWEANQITYDNLKLKTLSPSTVSHLAYLLNMISAYATATYRRMSSSSTCASRRSSFRGTSRPL